jgi:two-component system NtrC family sensor kinase
MRLSRLFFEGSTRAPRALLWLVVAAVTVPILLFFYGAWTGYEQLQSKIVERQQRTLDIIEEHGLKVFQTAERLLFEADQVLLNLSDEQIGAQERELSEKLKDIQQTIPEVQSIWAFGRDGTALVSSTVLPVFKTLNNSDREYFRALRDTARLVYVDKNVRAKVGDFTFFVVNRRRTGQNGAFNGIVALTLPPTNLDQFYQRVAQGTAMAAGLLRSDGSVLARYPTPPAGLVDAQTNKTFLEALAHGPESGAYTTHSGIDGVERLIAYRKLPTLPIYATAAYEKTAFWSEFRQLLTSMLAFGLPTVMLLGLVGTLAIRRTSALVLEYERREAAEDSLKQQQRLEALGRVTGGVAHDFNNLLMVVRGNADRLLRLGRLESTQERAVNAIVAAASHGEKLTRQLLTFARKRPSNVEVINLRERIPQLEEMLRASLTDRIQLVDAFDETLWDVEVDPADLDLAILNLVGNARDAMPDGGSITIAARNERKEDGAECVLLFVRDTGHGMAPELIERVFEPFFTTKVTGRGTGLGLSQVYGFAKQARGEATIVSTQGEGTEVTIRLPKASKPASRESADDASGVKQPIKILLVEDNLAVAEVTKANLQADGHTVVHAANGEAALDALQREKFDLVFSDIAMPGRVNGIELARRIRQSAVRVPTLLTTGFSDEAIKAVQDGFAIINKPYALAALRRSIQATLASTSCSSNGPPVRSINRSIPR